MVLVRGLDQVTGGGGIGAVADISVGLVRVTDGGLDRGRVEIKELLIVENEPQDVGTGEPGRYFEIDGTPSRGTPRMRGPGGIT